MNGSQRGKHVERGAGGLGGWRGRGGAGRIQGTFRRSEWQDLVTSLRWDQGKRKRRQGSQLAFDWGRRFGVAEGTPRKEQVLKEDK